MADRVASSIANHVLLVAGALAAPLLVVAYVGMTVLLSVPLLTVRRVLPRLSPRMIVT